MLALELPLIKMLSFQYLNFFYILSFKPVFDQLNGGCTPLCVGPATANIFRVSKDLEDPTLASRAPYLKKAIIAFYLPEKNSSWKV